MIQCYQPATTWEMVPYWGLSVGHSCWQLSTSSDYSQVELGKWNFHVGLSPYTAPTPAIIVSIKEPIWRGQR